MNTFNELTNEELLEYNGGNQASYEAGMAFGDIARKALVIVALIAIFA